MSYITWFWYNAHINIFLEQLVSISHFHTFCTTHSSAAARDSAESAKSSSAPSAEPSASTAPQGSAGKGPKDGLELYSL